MNQPARLRIQWRKSSRSAQQSNCVEAAYDTADLTWRKSARSGGQSDCVEAAYRGQVLLQNSKRRAPDGPMLAVAPERWLAFLDEVAAGRLDRERLDARARTHGEAFAVALVEGQIEVSDPYQADSPVVVFTFGEWDAFTTGVTQDGEFGLEWLLEPAKAGSLAAE